MKEDKEKPGEEKYKNWPEVRLPALYGPHCHRPWVQAFSAIARATEAIAWTAAWDSIPRS